MVKKSFEQRFTIVAIHKSKLKNCVQDRVAEKTKSNVVGFSGLFTEVFFA